MLMVNRLPLKIAQDTIRELRQPEINELLDLSALLELRSELGWHAYNTRQWERDF